MKKQNLTIQLISRTYQKLKLLASERFIYLIPVSDGRRQRFNHMKVGTALTQIRHENDIHSVENNGMEIPPSPRFEHSTLCLALIPC